MAFFDCQSGGTTTLTKVLLGTVRSTSASFSCTNIPNYTELTVDNFVVALYSTRVGVQNGDSGGYVTTTPSLSYNSSTGTLTVTNGYRYYLGAARVFETISQVYCFYVG